MLISLLLYFVQDPLRPTTMRNHPSIWMMILTKGFAFSGLTTDSGGGMPVSNPDRFTMLVESGTSDHSVDIELIADCNDAWRSTRRWTNRSSL